MRRWWMMMAALSMGGCDDGSAAADDDEPRAQMGMRADGSTAGDAPPDAGRKADAGLQTPDAPWPDCESEDGAPCCDPPPEIECPPEHHLTRMYYDPDCDCVVEPFDQAQPWMVLVEESCECTQGRCQNEAPLEVWGAEARYHQTDGTLAEFEYREVAGDSVRWVRFFCHPGADYAHKRLGFSEPGVECWDEFGEAETPTGARSCPADED